jgi:Family of unknown function (DUF6084)
VTPVPELELEVVSAGAEPDALIPILNFRVRIREREGRRVDSISLRSQIMVQATRRAYAPGEQEALLDLFGPPSRWGRTLKTMLWTHTTADVPGFSGTTEAILAVPCTHDLTISAGKYFFALEDGDVPLMFQFSGTVFWRDDDNSLQVAPIPWSKESAFRLPVSTWRTLMEEHDPDSAWLCLRRDTVDRLNRYKAHSGVPGWDEVVTRLLARVEEPAPIRGDPR